MRVKSTQRCCPGCGGVDFESANCKEGRGKLNGYTMQCLNCDWQGFSLQLIVKPGVKTAAEAAVQINEEARRANAEMDGGADQ
jgi:hypothetical protein